MNPLLKRIVTSLATATLAAVGIAFVPFKFVLPVMILLVALVHLEFSLMISKKYETMTALGVMSGVAWLVGAFYAKWTLHCATLTAIVLFLLSWLLALFGRYKTPLVALGTTWLGIIYIPIMLTFFIRIPATYGMMMLLYVVAIVKLSDMGGFAFGHLAKRLFGDTRKMCPTISPNKSWEGMLGSLIGSSLMSIAFMPVTHFGFVKAIAFGLLAAIVGTLGDLVESRFKRECGVKDSATFMPAGLGGFLDMFDSLIFAPAVLLMLI